MWLEFAVLPTFVKLALREEQDTADSHLQRFTVFRHTRWNLKKFFDQLIKNHNPQSSTRCLECGETLALFRRKHLLLNTAINHTAAHLGISLFSCARCNRQFPTRATIYHHLSKEHSLSSAFSKKYEYIDSTNDHYQVVTDMLTRCFGKLSK